MEKKILYIPNTDYIDGIPEILFIPLDNFFLFVVSFLLLIWSGLPVILAPIGALLLTWLYIRFKKKNTKNFYLTIPYRLGWVRPKGVPPITTDEFME